MTFDDLPEYPTGTEAVTWLATDNATLAAYASHRRRWHNPALASPLEVSPLEAFEASIRCVVRAIYAKLSPRAVANSDGAPPDAFETSIRFVVLAVIATGAYRKPTPDELTSFKGSPEEWGWWSWLRIQLGNNASRLSAAIDDLTNSLRSGALTARIEGTALDRETWFQHHLVFRDPDLVVMVADGGKSAWHGRTITVCRDDLRQLAPPQAEVSPVALADFAGPLVLQSESSTPTNPPPAPSDGEMRQWILDHQQSLKAAGKKHGRDDVLPAAREHFDVRHKVVLTVWKRR